MAIIIAEGKQSYTNDAGVPLAGGKLYTYDAGTTTPRLTWSDSAQTAPNTNPVILDARGEATIFWNGAYKVELRTAADVVIWTVDNVTTTPIGGDANSVITRLANAASTADGDAMIAVRKSVTGAVATTQHIVNEGRAIDLIADYGCVADGATLGNGAKINAALASGAGFIWVPDGVYIIDQDLIVPDNIVITFSKGATFKASANGRVFFKSTTSAYFSQIWNATLDGNGRTSVVGFDMTNFRLQAGLFNCACTDTDVGFISRSGNFGTQVLNFNTIRVPNPVQVIANSSVLDILHPTFDNGPTVAGTGLGIGVDVQLGGGSNLGVRIIGGYIQGFVTGVQDAAIGTHITDTYFETNSAADVSGVGARNSNYAGLQLFGPSGAAGVKLLNCDAITIFNPTMASGARTALYDVDVTNTNCVEYRTQSATSINTPLGSVAFLGSLPIQTIGTFTPVVVGSATAGVGTYTTQSGKWSRTGNVVNFDLTITWTAHTGTGNITVTGLPAGVAPASFTPVRIFHATTNGLAFTGPVLYGTFTGSGSIIGMQQLTAAGVVSLLPIAGTGTLNISGTYEL